MIYLELFWSFFQIGLFSIGGGYAAMPLIQNQIVEINKWLTMAEFADVVTIAEMTPGPIAINASTFVGIRIAGIKGAVVATFGCVLPSIIIVFILAYIYYKYKGVTYIQGVLGGLRPAIVAMVFSAGLSIFLISLFDIEGLSFKFLNINYVSAFIFILSIIALRKFKLNPVYVIVGSGIFTTFIYKLM